MTFELEILVWSVLVLAVTIIAHGATAVMNNGMSWGLGNREKANPPTALQGRMQRAAANGIEATVLFAPLAAATAIAGISTETTQLGAMLFLGSRILFPVVYGLGVPVLRTLVWVPGIAGTVMIAAELLTHG